MGHLKAWLLRCCIPSLTRRIVSALLLAFLVVWLVLTGKSYVDIKTQQPADLNKAAQSLLYALQGVNHHDAHAALVTIEKWINTMRAEQKNIVLGDALFQLASADGQLVYASSPLRNKPLITEHTLQIGTQHYLAEIKRNAEWRVVVLDPILSDSSFFRFAGIEMLPSLLIAFPFVLLPIWFAVQRGLSPLRRFVQQIAARSPDDSSQLETNLRYAELQPLAAAFEALLAKMRQHLARERSFVQDAAHELRTPLAVINAQAHLLENATDPATQTQARAAMENAVERASYLIEQLLTLAKLDHATQALQHVDLVELTRNIIIEALPHSTARQIDLALESPEQLITTVDTSAYQSILDNLLRNALSYTSPGTHVVVSLTATATTLCLSVLDNGNGIAADEREQIFQRFYRGRHVTTPGTGLGLAIVQQAACRLGGSVRVGEGLNGKGVGFWVEWLQ